MLDLGIVELQTDTILTERMPSRSTNAITDMVPSDCTMRDERGMCSVEPNRIFRKWVTTCVGVVRQMGSVNVG